MPVLDTSFIIDLIRGREEALMKLAELEAKEISLSMTEINILELYRGAYLSCKIQENIEVIKKIQESFQILRLEEPVYEVFASLSAKLLSEDKPIGTFDELITSISLCWDGQIITRDSHYKKIAGLKVIDY